MSHLNRRAALGLGAAALTFPSFAFAAASEKRLVVIVLRGGMDGLAAAPPVGDPAYVGARKGLALPRAGANAVLALDSTFALHPRLTNMHAMYRAGELTLVHAVGTPYRERSHFDAQNVLETGAARPFARGEGWLNAALQALPQSTRANRPELGIAIAAQAPLILQGRANVATWSASPMKDADPDTIARLMRLYEARDRELAGALQSAVAANGIAEEGGMMEQAGNPRRAVRALAPTAVIAAGFLKQANGPVACVIEMGGWDTHANQGSDTGLFATNMGFLDDGVAALKRELGPTWRNTAVLIVTEFGRTVAPNGNRGTDHGTGMAAFLCGGAVAGGKVIADWPGLAGGQLLDNRDVKPTTDLRAILAGVLHEHLGVPQAALTQSVFPGASGLALKAGLVKA
jgi:uncharacterized protein (DUF1501 family)